MAVDMNKLANLDRLKEFKTAENAMIAGKPESTNAATVAHAVGEYFYWKGVLHIVTAAIAVGGTIQTNTNVKPAVLADDVSDLKESINNKLMELLPTPILNYKMLVDGDASYTPNELTYTCVGNIYKLTNPIEYPHTLTNACNACNILRISTGGYPAQNQAVIEAGFSIKITILKGSFSLNYNNNFRIPIRFEDNTLDMLYSSDNQKIQYKSGDVVFFDLTNPNNLKWAYSVGFTSGMTINEETWLQVDLISSAERTNLLAMILEN